jgi:signal transduction histidine kinase
LTSLFAIRFLYAIYYDRMPKLFWAWLALAVGFIIYSWQGPMQSAFWYNLITFAEILRVVVLAIVRKKRYAWIIAIGVSAFVLASAFQIVQSLIAPEQGGETPYYLYGLLVMMILMSVGLALGYAKINTALGEQLVRVKDLSAQALEHERKAKEEEVARMQLEADNALKAIELEEANKRQKVLDQLEATNRDLRQAQSQLVQSEKMASLGNLVAGVAHEINTPIGAISSMHNTLVRAVVKLKASLDEALPHECEEDARIKGALKIIEDATSVIESGSGRVTNIVKRLRSFARLDEAELKEADLHEGIEDTLTLIHHELKHGITVHKNYGKIPSIACYPGQLNQVFLNILMNARQAISDSGDITITTRQQDAHVVIEITDTGKGIPAEQLGKVFDPGFTTKGVGVGTGLGLSICYRIIQDHKGQIKVDSVVNAGTTFTILLPMNLGKNSK